MLVIRWLLKKYISHSNDGKNHFFSELSLNIDVKNKKYTTCTIGHLFALCTSQGQETSALLILEKISDKNLINSTNTALQT